MSETARTIESLKALREELDKGVVPSSVEELRERLDPLSIGLIHQCPLLGASFRMFRIREMTEKPHLITDVGAPPPDVSPIGRLNEKGQSVLYLADSPDTAFVECGEHEGEFVLSEWRVTAEKLGMANGAIPPSILADRFPNQLFDASSKFLPRQDADEIQKFFREIYTMNVGKNPLLYRWSIACGLVNGFAHKCDRKDAGDAPEGFMRWEGRCPLSGIAYPSVRTNQKSLNFALNDRGRSHVKIDHLQWVRRVEDGSYISLDFANDWDSEKLIRWQNRPVKFQLKPGESAKVTKVTKTAWKYETEDGSIPWFV